MVEKQQVTGSTKVCVSAQYLKINLIYYYNFVHAFTTQYLLLREEHITFFVGSHVNKILVAKPLLHCIFFPFRHHI